MYVKHGVDRPVNCPALLPDAKSRTLMTIQVSPGLLQS